MKRLDDEWDVSRRGFIVGASLLAGGLLVSCKTLRRGSSAKGVDDLSEKPVFTANAWVRIMANGKVVVILDRVEMGQGTMTGHTAMVAEELGVQPEDIVVQFAPPDAAYANPALGAQMTGASTSTASSWTPLRLAGATARDMLITAGAKQLGVSAAECRCEGGYVVHSASGKKASFAAVAPAAAQVAVPTGAQPKAFKDFKVLGQSVKRLDSLAKVLGTATYGIDVTMPNLLIAVLLRPPAHGGHMDGFDDAKAKAYWDAQGVKGFVVPTTRGLALVAPTYWLARTAAGLVTAKFSGGRALSFDGSMAALATAQGLTRDEAAGAVVVQQGNAPGALAAASAVVQATYEVPYLPHQTMEPMNCTATYAEGKLEMWVPSQVAGSAQHVACQATGLQPEQVVIHTTFIGGGFGRRLSVDYVYEAAEIAKAVRQPVKLIWSREDDIQHDFYRPGMAHVLRGSVNSSGIDAWSQRVIGPSILKCFTADTLTGPLPERMRLTPTAAALALDGAAPPADPYTTEGADKTTYAIANRLVRYSELDPGIPVGFWRSVGHSHTGFAGECFVDELAAAAQIDPLLLRQRMLQPGRDLAVLNQVAAMANWGSVLPPAPAGSARALGIALHGCFNSYCAQVIQVLVSQTTVTVERVWAAVDVGFALNPDIVTAQVEGAIIFGLSGALKQKVTFQNGATQQSNFNNCPVMRIGEVPDIQVALVGAGGAAAVAPTGVGELAVPAVAAALANALFRATGQRYRSLPIPLATGLVRTASSSTSAPVTAGVDPSLRSAAQASIDANCAPCHQAPAAEGNISNISDLDALVGKKGTRKRLKTVVGNSMPPKIESNGQRLSPISPADKQAIFKWLDAVAKSRGE